jgi:hypothetical protein
MPTRGLARRIGHLIYWIHSSPPLDGRKASPYASEKYTFLTSV